MSINDNIRPGLDIAIIGMAGRFPGAGNIDEFWENLKSGVESIRFFTDQELIEAGVSPSLLEDPHYVRAKGVIEDFECFDAAFFGYTPGEAEKMDPQVRIFHQCVWHALEDAGYEPEAYGGAIGLYGGASNNTAWEVLALHGDSNIFINVQLTDKDHLSTRISHNLNLSGPSFTIETQCSTSLVAFHLACQALLSGECDMSVAGGISMTLPPKSGYLYQEGLLFSPDGHCRSFDKRAEGTVFGNGAGAVVLRRIEEAITDGDHIYAVVKGTAVNNDGSRKISYSAPGVDGQMAVIRMAHKIAQVDPESITYVEAHGTGTSLGDPIEVEALKLAFNTDKRGFCRIGSVKANVGHLDNAAGITGMIKTVLALKHKLIPPNPYFEEPNPKIDFENSPFRVVTRLTPWESDGHPLRAGVNSFGIGGTNAHVILEESPLSSSAGQRSYHIIVLSAKTEAALEHMNKNLADFFKKSPGINLADAAYTLQVGRKRFPYRRKLLGAGISEVIDRLTAPESGTVQTYVSKEEGSKPIVFVFPGLGDPHVNMGRTLYEKEPYFRSQMDRCFKILAGLLADDIKEIVYPEKEAAKNTEEHVDVHEISGMEIGQLVVFIFEYSLARLLMKWGIKPRAMIGYDSGEYAAACMSGVFSPEDALKLLVTRGRIQRQLQAGMMAAPLLEEFEREAGTISFNSPRIPYVSTVTGRRVAVEDAASPAYWARQLRETGHFAEGVRQLLKKERNPLFLVVGAGRDVSARVQGIMEGDEKADPGHQLIHLVPHRRPGTTGEIPDDYYLLDKIGLLWLYGVSIDWQEYYAEERRCRVSLPSYPFEKQRFWKLFEAYRSRNISRLARKQDRPSAKTGDLSDWFYVPSWKRQQICNTGKEAAVAGGDWLVFGDPVGLAEGFIEELRGRSSQPRIITVRAGSQYFGHSDLEYTINPAQYDDYDRLFNALEKTGITLRRVVHFWGITNDEGEGDGLEPIRESRNRVFYSLLYLARALGRHGDNGGTIDINVVTDNMQQVTGQEKLQPGKATVLGPCRVIPQEYPGIRCRSIDLADWQVQAKTVIPLLLKEVMGQNADVATVVAYRGHFRWVQSFEPLRLEKPGKESSPLLRPGGVYLIVGGLGDIGYILAELLVKGFKAKIIITGRSPLPPPERWSEYLTNGDKDDGIARKIRKLHQLRESGGDVLYFAADVADRPNMQAAIRQSEAQWGPINGVIHSAGIVSRDAFHTIADISESECRRQFRAKLDGLPVLEDLLKDKELDFCLIVSSISTILGGLGFAAYAAANHFLDAFSARCNQKRQEPWIVVDWEGANRKDTVEAFRRIFSTDSIRQIVFSMAGDLEGKISRWVNLEGHYTPLYSRPALSNPYVAPRDAVEEKLADIWQRFFGMDRIGVTDSLFHLGGDSLKMINLISTIRRELKKTVPLKEFFDNPTIEGVARYVAGARREIYTAIEPVEKREFYALSSAQKRLFILQQMDRESTAYNEPRLVLLEGRLDRERLEENFGRLINRHEVLRSSIEILGGEPQQRVYDPAELPFKFEYFDLTTADTRQPEGKKAGNTNRVDEITRAFIRPFDLSQAPFLRVGLIKIADVKHLLMIDIHHIVTDGTSYQIFIREFMASYLGEELPPLKIQYKDYAIWQNRERQQESLRRQEAYWIRELAGERPALNIVTDYPRPAEQSFAGSSIPFKIEPAALRKMANKEDVTLYMLLLSLYNILLSKLADQEDIIIGTPVAGRRHIELQNMLGIFVNTLTLRNCPAGNKTFREFLNELKANTIKAFENQDYQFEDLVDQVAENRDASRNPIFDVVFAFRSAEVPDAELSGLKLSPFKYESTVAKFDLTLIVNEAGEGLSFKFEYSTKIFKRETIERFIKYFKNIAADVMEKPECRIVEIEVISEGEKRQILDDFNDTATEYPGDKAIHEVFEDQQRRTPYHIALMGHSSGGGSPGPEGRGVPPGVSFAVTYRELNRRSDHLAFLLRDKGVRPDTVVALSAERSIELVMVIIGILKAGGAYLPLDLDYPEERVNFMLADSNALLHLTTRILDREDHPQPPNFSNSPILSPANLAYILYTSGSTGRPKGVMVTHRSVIRLVKSTNYIAPGTFTRLLQTGPLTFDASTFEIWGPLLNGGVLCVIPPSVLLISQQLKERMRVYCINTLWMTAPLFNNMVETDIEIFAGLQYLLVGGDRLSPSHINRVHRQYPRLAIINGYGPTENTTFSTTFAVHRDYEGRIPIGKPLANSTAYVVGRYYHLQPVGIPGELWVGGDGLARGYLNNPELTAERFVQLQPPDFKPQTVKNRIANAVSRILYRTGDVARWLPDGNIDYLGRIDRQVKIRGYRIELEEIENQLLKHDAINEALVTAKEGNGDNAARSLLAYIVSGKEWMVSELREFLSRKLPDYMIPSYFLQMDRLPRTPSGKLDRNSLPEPGEYRPNLKETFVAPQTDREKIFADIWKEVLKLDEVGIHDNFFDVGGNSLHIIQVNHKLKEVFGQELPVMSMFRYTTIHSYCRFLSRQGLAGTANKVGTVARKRRLEALKQGKHDIRQRYQRKKNA